MLGPNERVLVACSGGPDSTALFHLFRELAPGLCLHLSLLHFDHRLRPESSKDYRFVQALARRFEIPFYGGKNQTPASAQKTGLSPEEAARKIRYEFFEQIAKKTRIKKIALAHHRDDQAETVLMRLIQGTGLRGLQGIRPAVKIHGITFIRPLIETSRREIQMYLKERGLSWREDATNRSNQFLRNRIRNRLLPLLEKEFNPLIREALARLAETSYQESAGFDEWVRERASGFLKSRRNESMGLDRENFLKLPRVLQFRLLDEFLHKFDPASGLDFKSWARIAEGLKKGRFRQTLPKRVDVSLTSKRLVLKREENDTMKTQEARNRPNHQKGFELEK